jgi:hypothetical protein
VGDRRLWLPGLPLDGRTLTLDEVGGDMALHLHAKVKATTIVGSLLRFSHASFTSDEEPQICTTGDLTWTATRTVPAPTTAQRTPVGSTFVRKMGGATITFTRLR